MTAWPNLSLQKCWLVVDLQSAATDLSQSGLTEITERPFSFTTTRRGGGQDKMQIATAPNARRR